MILGSNVLTPAHTPDVYVLKKAAYIEQSTNKKGVKRKLELEADSKCIQLELGETWKIENGHNCKQYVKRHGRFDTSLVQLTKQFMDIVKQSNNGVIDLNHASATLNIQKRRIYDVTNVLEGIGLVIKQSKNKVMWRDSDNELTNLDAKENHIDQLITYAKQSLRQLTDNLKQAYVTHSDLHQLGQMCNQTLLIIKCPPETQLQFPEEMHVKSKTGHVDVFLLPDEECNKINQLLSQSSNDIDASFLSPKKNSQLVMDCDPSFTYLSNEQEDFLCVKKEQNDLELSEQFLPLEPSFPEFEYNFTLGDCEGICDLFDFNE